MSLILHGHWWAAALVTFAAVTFRHAGFEFCFNSRRFVRDSAAHSAMAQRLLATDLTGRVAVVTGPTSGLGRHTAIALARSNATVVLACRDMRKGQALADEINGLQKVAVVIHLDLADLKTVGPFVSEFQRRFDQLNILINNAGVPASSPMRLSADGVEQTFQVNHLGHFHLTQLLLPSLLASSPRPARVVHVSSSAHRLAPADGAWASGDGEGLRDAKAYGMLRAYAIANLAQALFSQELDRR